MVSLTNGDRANDGVRRLAVASDLMSIAERHSREMAARRSTYHNSSLPNEVSGWNSLAENVGRGKTADGVNSAFMSSSVHRANILNASYDQIGVGAVRGSDGYLYVTEVFVERGSTGSVHPRRYARHVVRRAVGRRVRAARPRIGRVTVAYPDLSVGLLLRILALDTGDAAGDTVRKDMAVRPPPS